MIELSTDKFHLTLSRNYHINRQLNSFRLIVPKLRQVMIVPFSAADPKSFRRIRRGQATGGHRKRLN